MAEIKKHVIKNNRVAKTFIYIYIFFIFYMPRISDLLLGVKIEVFSVLAIIVIFIPWLVFCKNKKTIFLFRKNNLKLFSGIIISAVYFAIRAYVSSNNIRIFQNLYIIIQIFHIIIAIDFMKYLGFTKDSMIKVLFDLALIQGLITIIMLLFPSTKNIALSLYYLGSEENIFISRMRIYGISGDYTFFTPIYHSILASLVFYYSIFKDKKYIIYLPFILLTILLNGRFGLFIFAISPILIGIHFLLKGKVNLSSLKILLSVIILIGISILLLSIISPYTYSWIISGFKEIIKLLIYNEKTGNMNALLGYHLSFPKGKNIILGAGFRLYGGQAFDKGYPSSDIGYINDIFMGGLIYISILYGTIIRFLIKKIPINNFINEKAYTLQSLFSKHLVIGILLANYKGEVMRGGIVLLVSIYIKVVLSIKEVDLVK